MSKVFEVHTLEKYFYIKEGLPEECFEFLLNYPNENYIKENFGKLIGGITYSGNEDFANAMIEKVGSFKMGSRYYLINHIGPMEYSDKSTEIIHNALMTDVDLILQYIGSPRHHHLMLKAFRIRSLPYLSTSQGFNIFKMALIYDAIELLRRLFEITDYDSYDFDDYMGRSLFHIAVEYNSILCLEFLIDIMDLDINRADFIGMTALHRACSDNKGKCIQLLLQREDIRLDLFDNRRLLAIQHCHPDFLHLFINPMTTRNFSMESVGETFKITHIYNTHIKKQCRICKKYSNKFPKGSYNFKNKSYNRRLCLYCSGSEYEEAFSHIIKHMPWNHYLPIIYDILFKNNNNIYQLTRDCDNENNDNNNNDAKLFFMKNNLQTTQFNKYYNHKSFREFSMDYNEDGYKEENINCQKCSFQSKNIYDFIQNGFYNPNSYKGDKLKLKNKKTICIHCKVIDQRALSFIHKDYSYLT
eukprot:TRINITY_DN2360_c0_g2_i4.p1 TRINITY_DN2360_c0_g2~~TRINITY_DN2360_c0_g2_i4.p1  ORF type:complete len:471 (-),score=92.07 TRINITY_DN2360_c0_g2_i4:47-1459(-)